MSSDDFSTHAPKPYRDPIRELANRRARALQRRDSRRNASEDEEPEERHAPPPHKLAEKILSCPIDAMGTKFGAALQAQCERHLTDLGCKEVFDDRDFQRRGVKLLDLLHDFEKNKRVSTYKFHQRDEEHHVTNQTSILLDAGIVIDGMYHALSQPLRHLAPRPPGAPPQEGLPDVSDDVVRMLPERADELKKLFTEFKASVEKAKLAFSRRGVHPTLPG